MPNHRSVEIGKKYNRWTVIEWVEGKALCKCECGTLRKVRPACVKKGTSKSCGCLQRELVSIRNTKEVSENYARQRGRIEYFKSNTWGNINKRTINGSAASPKNRKLYPSYYKKGIKLNITKEEFYNWCDTNKDIIMGLYKENKTPSIDRINNNGHYELANMQILSLRDNAKKSNRRPKL